jgi:guanylate kinase
MAARLTDLLVVVGPSGVGKSTLIARLTKEFPEAFGYSVSHTTRPMRAGEVDGQSYHFVTAELFRDLVAKGKFLEHAVVHDTYYGTSEDSVRAVLQKDRVCFMDLDIVGAQNLRKHPSLRSLVVFVVPPSFEVLERRLKNRGTESDEKIAKRLSDGKEWVRWFKQHQDFFDFSFLNDDLDTCYAEFRDAIMSSAFDMDVSTHYK